LLTLATFAMHTTLTLSPPSSSLSTSLLAKKLRHGIPSKPCSKPTCFSFSTQNLGIPASVLHILESTSSSLLRHYLSLPPVLPRSTLSFFSYHSYRSQALASPWLAVACRGLNSHRVSFVFDCFSSAWKDGGVGEARMGFMISLWVCIVPSFRQKKRLGGVGLK